MVPVVLITFILFLAYYAYRRKQIDKVNTQKESDFWQRENDANSTRKQDITNLDYIQIPVDFPVGAYPNEGYEETEQQLLALSEQKILNLTGISNTDLKLQYGVSNLAILSDCDERFTTLVRLLTDYAKGLAEHAHIDDAIRVLEFGVSIKSDVTENYTLLAGLYQEKGETAKISDLIESADSLNSLSKDTIRKKLREILS